MDGDSFLPSEIARLVLGYLKKTGCNQSYQVFLNECPHLEEYASLLRRGAVYPTSIGGKDLDKILKEYGNQSMGVKRQEPADQLYRKLDYLVQKLSSFESTPSKQPICHTVRSSSLHGGVLYKDDSDSDTDLSNARSIPNLAVLRGTEQGSSFTPVSRPTVQGRIKQANSGQSDSGISVGQRSGQAFSSSSPSLPSTNSSPCLDMPISIINQNQSEAAISAVSQWDITPITSSAKHRKTQPAKNLANVTSTMSTPISVKLPNLSGRDQITIKLPRGNLPLLLDNFKETGAIQKGSKSRPAKESEIVHRQQTYNSSDISHVQTSQSNKDRIQNDKDSADNKLVEDITVRLPDFDDLDSPPVLHKSMLEPQSSQLTSTNQFKTPEQLQMGTNKPMVLVECRTTDLLKTPVKNFLTHEDKDAVKNASSPRRKRQPPKRRSAGVEFPLTGRPRVSPCTAGPAEFLVPVNSNDSFMSQNSQGFVPRIEELFQNSKFAEKLADNINRVALQKHGNKPPSNSTDKQEDQEITQALESTEAKLKHTNPHITSEELDQILMEDDTINNIIDMTKNDPDFDILFNMFHVDKNEFIEKEYGVKPTEHIESSQNLTFANLLSSSTNSGTTLCITQPMYSSETLTIASQSGSSTTALSTMETVSPMTMGSSSREQLPETATVASSTHEVSQVKLQKTTNTPSSLPVHAASLHSSSSVIIDMATSDHKVSMQVSKNTSSAKESNFVQLVYPSPDGKSSVFETVEVITVPEEISSQVNSQTETNDVPVLPVAISAQDNEMGHTTVFSQSAIHNEMASLTEGSELCTNPTVEPSLCTNTTVEIAQCTNTTVEIAQCTDTTVEVAQCTNTTVQTESSTTTPATKADSSINKENITQGIADALNLLSPILSPLLVSQALLLHMVKPKDDLSSCSTLSAHPFLQSLTKLQKSLTSNCSADGLGHLQQKITAGNLPTDIQTKTLEQLTQLVSIPVSSTPSISSKSALNVGSEVLSQVTNLDSLTSSPMAKLRKPTSSEANTPGKKSRLPKRVKGLSPTCSVCSDNGEAEIITLEDEEEEEMKVTYKTKKRGVNTVMHIKKPRKIEPWKIDITKDKRKFLGVVWKSGTMPAEQKPLTQESASLLVEHYESDQAEPKTKSKPVKKSKTTESDLPELSARDVTEVANSPRFGSTVDTSGLTLSSVCEPSLDCRKTDMSESKCYYDPVKNSDSTGKKRTKKHKDTNHVRALDFQPQISKSEKCTKSTDARKHVTFNVDQKTPVKGSSIEDSEIDSPGLSMPSSFEFVFNEESKQKSEKSCPKKRMTSNHTKTVEYSPRHHTRSQAKAAKIHEETEVAETLISLAQVPIITPTKSVASEVLVASNGALNVSKKLFENETTTVSLQLKKVGSKQVPAKKLLKTRTLSKIKQGKSASKCDTLNVPSSPFNQQPNIITKNLHKLPDEMKSKDKNTVLQVTKQDCSPQQKQDPPQKPSDSPKPSPDAKNITVLVDQTNKKSRSISEEKTNADLEQVIENKLDESIGNVQTSSGEAMPQWNSLESPRTVVCNSSVVFGSPTGSEVMHMRVASKPATMAAREQVKITDGSSMKEAVHDNNNTDKKAGKAGKDDGVTVEEPKAQTTHLNVAESNISNKARFTLVDIKPNNTSTFETVSQTVMKTPVKSERRKKLVHHTCSPKRTFTLNKLLEQSMKTLSKIDPSVGQRINLGVCKKSGRKRALEVGPDEKGPKAKKSKKKGLPQIPISNLSGLDVEKFLSKIHK